MRAGHIVGMVLGAFFIWLGIHISRRKDDTQEKINEWKRNYPKTTARITGTVTSRDSNGDYDGYYYSADLLVDGQWYKARSWDRFRAKMTCQIAEEVEVAYRPVPQTQGRQLLDSMMSAMLDTLGEDWEAEKPRYDFKILDAAKYQNEQARHRKNAPAGILIFCGFGGLILLITLLSACGIIA